MGLKYCKGLTEVKAKFWLTGGAQAANLALCLLCHSVYPLSSLLLKAGVESWNGPGLVLAQLMHSWPRADSSKSAPGTYGSESEGVGRVQRPPSLPWSSSDDICGFSSSFLDGFKSESVELWFPILNTVYQASTLCEQKRAKITQTQCFFISCEPSSDEM